MGKEQANTLRFAFVLLIYLTQAYTHIKGQIQINEFNFVFQINEFKDYL